MEINILEEICKVAYSFKATVYNSYELAKEMINVDGDFVECGVAAGAQIAAMQLALIETNCVKNIYAFDSFEGIPMAGEFDTSQPGIGEIYHDKYAPLKERLVSSGITSHSIENVIHNFNEFKLPLNNINFIKGWFQDTLPDNKIDKISLLRLDGDLYESTFVCLQYLYPKVSIGGYVIIDDYALEGCMKAVHDYFSVYDFFTDIPVFTEVKGGGGVVYFKKNK